MPSAFLKGCHSDSMADLSSLPSEILSIIAEKVVLNCGMSSWCALASTSSRLRMLQLPGADLRWDYLRRTKLEGPCNRWQLWPCQAKVIKVTAGTHPCQAVH